ncbi:asialoglycoprotein receptor 2-like [Protopterus annectens]|uniref:asialoglycoprotein receptor 2-like n=1 Tax=Protopterus annectens TaxID=7888 RepID=UPI001CFBDFB1|nr:asialoglycoprotein receptor 2-like [Protopterus annectens]XP_043924793.1 asialoglycoprotein receptor 2-like [Protopterus annectens]
MVMQEEGYRKFNQENVNEDTGMAKLDVFEVQDSHFFRPRTCCETLLRVLQCVLLAVCAVLLLVLIAMVTSKFWHVSQDLQEMKSAIDSLNASMLSASEVNKGKSQYLESGSTQDTKKDPCFEDWELFQGSCYQLSEMEEQWDDAKKACESEGAHLMIITSLEEQRQAWKFMRDVGVNIWIGLHDIDEEGDWRWVDGTMVSAMPQFWDYKQPDNWDHKKNRTEDCGSLHRHGSLSSGWNDDYCMEYYRYICEKEV